MKIFNRIFLILLFSSTSFAFSQKIVFFSRSVTLNSANQLEVTYSVLADTCKGFFTITDTIAGKVKLVSVTGDYPCKFQDNLISISGHSLKAGNQVKIIFKTFHESISVKGYTGYENYPNEPLTQSFDPIYVEIKKPEPELKEEVKPIVLENKPTVVNADNSGIRFRVQIAASTSKMDTHKLAKLTGLDLPVREDFIDIYFKYTVGNEQTFDAAQGILNKLAADNFKKPFIVAYSDGKRISVQQAMAEIKAKD